MEAMRIQLPDARVQARIVEEHVRQENAHDLDGVMSTFGGSDPASRTSQVATVLLHPMTILGSAVRGFLHR